MSRNNEMRRSMLAELLEGQPIPKKQKTIPAAAVSTLMLDGARAFEERRYEDAVKFFSHALENVRDRKADLLHVYDFRSCASSKLQRYEEALKDAKQMIRLDKADFRGYLRCAQIEQIQGKYKEAVRVCDYGLKSIPAQSSGYHQLEKCRLRIAEQLKQSVVFEKGTNPMLVLPTELLEIVLSYFDYQQHIAVMRVCKTWRDRIQSTDLVSRTIDTRKSAMSLTHEQTRATFARLGQQPRSLAFKNLNESAARYASMELGRWIRWEHLENLVLEEPKMQNLRLRWDKLARLRHLRLGYYLDTRQDLLSVLGTCSNLQSATLFVHPVSPLFQDRSASNQGLRSLSVHGKIDKVTLVELQNGCLFPALQTLELNNVSSNRDVNLSQYTQLRDLSLRNCRFRENLRTPPTLESFTLHGNFANTYPNPEEIKMPAGNIHTVHVKGNESIKFLTYARRQGLSSAKLRNVFIADFVAFSNFAGRFVRNDLSMLHTYTGSGVFDQVSCLGLQDDNIVDEDSAIVNKLFIAAEHLDIEAPQITDSFVSDVVRTSGCRVKTITLRNCTNVPLSIIDWCQARNVKVTILRQSIRSLKVDGTRVRFE